MTIAVLTPTRHRLNRLQAMLDSVFATAAIPGDIWVYVGVDMDDRDYDDLDRANVVVVRESRMQLAAWTNHLAELALEDGATILASLGDDHQPRTQGWDEQITAAAAELGSGLVYCADGLKDEKLPTAPFWTADIVEALGWYCPPTLTHMYVDNYWLRLANDLDRRVYLPDVLIEHMHPGAGKAEPDESYRDSEAGRARDKAAFDAFLEDGHAAALDRARAVLR